MPFHITREHLGRLDGFRRPGGMGGLRRPGHTDGEAMSLRHKLSAIMEEQKQNIEKATAIVEVGAAAFGLGFLHGRKGGMPETFGIPWDLGSAALLHLLGFSGYAEGYEQHLHNLGNGALAYYVGSMGAQIGQKMRQEVKTGDDAWKGSPFTEEEAKKRGLGVRTITAGTPGGVWSPAQQAAMYRGW
jgi:hypothetical protein